MGLKCTIVAVSPGIPRDDILTRDEGGPDAARAALAALVGGDHAYAGATTMEQGLHPGDGVCVGTWGDTVVLGFAELGDALDHPAATPAGTHLWRLIAHSVTDTCLIEVTGPTHDRSVNLWADMDADDVAGARSGTPLPFERPYLDGEHPDELAPGFHPLDLANAAHLWILGVEAETPPADDVVTPLLAGAKEPWDVPMHHFTPAAAAPAQEAAKPFWKKLFG